MCCASESIFSPGYRRLSYFLLSAIGYLVVGRAIGVLSLLPADQFLIQEMVGLAALFASEALPKVVAATCGWCCCVWARWRYGSCAKRTTAAPQHHLWCDAVSVGVSELFQGKSIAALSIIID